MKRRTSSLLILFSLGLMQSCGSAEPEPSRNSQGTTERVGLALGGAYCAGVTATFCDDFADGNSNGWTGRGGTWSVVTDSDPVLKQSGSGTPALATVDSTSGMKDQTIQSSVKVLKFGGTTSSYRAGIAARYKSSSEMYVFALNGSGALVILKGATAITGTGCSAVASGLSNLYTWNMFKLQVTGSSTVAIKTYFNGKQIHNCSTTASPVTAGYAGVYTYGTNTQAEFDQYTVNLTKPGLCDKGDGTPKSAGTVCRAAVDLCDVAETCNGKDLVCPADAFKASGTVCRASAGVCDAAEVCSGTNAACPSDTLASSSTVCRAAAGLCDVPENCTGTSAACPSDARKPSGTVCRALAGPCDVAEVCTGTSASCPADGFALSSITCRPAAGPCDIAESCTGMSAVCPADQFALVSMACRPAAGPCDAVEICNGASPLCPADILQPPTTVCRASTGACDPAENCTGLAIACPADVQNPPVTAPTGLTATPGVRQVLLRWGASAGATGYKVKRGTAAGGPYAVVAVVSVPTYTDAGRSIGTPYYYVVSATGCGDSADSSEVTSVPIGNPGNAVNIQMPFPKGLDVDTVGVAANGGLQIRDRATVKNADGSWGAVANAGNGETGIGVVSRTGNVTSVGPVFLRDRTQIMGNVTTAGSLTRQNLVSVTGTITEHATLTPLVIHSWTAIFPSTNAGDIVLPDNDTRSLYPGGYANVTASYGAKLSLQSGEYYFASLDVEWQAKLSLNMAKGPIIVYVTDTFMFKGELLNEGGRDGDFLLVYLGNADVVLETSLTGTIVAPNASLTLGSTTDGHRGGFYARDIEVRPDDKVVFGSFPWSSIGSPTGSCTDDSDYDGVPDCVDLCPYDPKKTKPGVCNCGIEDTDSDSDGVPDCLEPLCAGDPNKTSRGQCGCAGSAGLKPAGTSCTDPSCPEVDSVCDGAGQCGDPTGCGFGPDCRLISWEGSSYWFCGVWSSSGRQSWTDAQESCAAKGMALAKIDWLTENQFIQKLIAQPVWVGGNSVTSLGVWRWATQGSNDGDQFWAGDAAGTRVGDWLANWEVGAPGAARCMAINPADGRWTDTACATVLGYACEYRAPLPPGEPYPGPGGMAAQPPDTGIPCIDEADAGLPMPLDDSEAAKKAAQDELKTQIAQTDAGIFKGAAANPPEAGAKCHNDPNSNALGAGGAVGCELIETKDESRGCVTNKDCEQYGPQFVCRRTKLVPNCNPPDANPGYPIQGQTCPGTSICGILSCPTDDQKCDEIEICNPGSDVDAGLDPNSQMDPTALDPASLFPNGRPDAGPSAVYWDPPTGQGTEHSWCKMSTQNPQSVPTATAPVDDKRGESGGSSPVKFIFDPDLVFDVSAKPLALGETNLSLHAQAKLVARVELQNFLGQSYGADIISAIADIRAQRCSINTDQTEFRILGLDVIEPSALPRINTDDKASVGEYIYNLSKQCNEALAAYQVAAGRVKKAFRDAQQLLEQYHGAIAAGKMLSDNLCDVLGMIGLDVPGFPGGARCYSNESVEALINRFIYYYQAPGVGQLTKLRDVAGYLSSVTSDLKKELGTSVKLGFKDGNHQESQTIVSVPFAIGPIPMILQIDLATSYGIGGEFSLDLQFPGNLLDGAGAPPSRIAHVGASVLPHASAALSAFVGAGFDYGPFSASVGLEGSVQLADIRAPLFAGAGLEMEVTQDVRPLPIELKPPVSFAANAYALKIPRAFKFRVSYDYGAAVDLINVLSGEIKARLRIRFCFFSRTWRKRVVLFKGWSRHFDLVKGGGSADIHIGGDPKPVPNTAEPASLATSAPVAVGSTEMGRSEGEVPLMELAYLPGTGLNPVNPPDGGAETIDFNPANISKPFYDDLCCAKLGAQCQVGGTPYPPCCSDLACHVPAGGDTGTCEVQCRGEGATCSETKLCCTGFVCGSADTCRVCIWPYLPCSYDRDCCSNVCNIQTRLCDQIVY